MLKNFMVLYVILIAMFMMYIKKDDGSREHDENTLIITISLTIYLLIAMILTVIIPELRNLIEEEIKMENIAPNVAEDKIIYASAEHSCSCIVEQEDVDGLIELVNTITKKEMLLAVYGLMAEHGKILVIKENTKAHCYYAEEHRGYVPVIFLDGKYKGRRVYVPMSRLE